MQKLMSFFRKLKRLTDIELLKLEFEKLRRWRTWVPAGHFYSPLPSVKDIKAREASIFQTRCGPLAGINLNEKKQLSILESFSETYKELPFEERKKDGHPYYYENPFYSYADGIVLYSFMRMLKPKRIVEIGSGFSSALMLETNALHFGNSIKCTFIEPHPERLQGLLGNTNLGQIDLRVMTLQETPMSVFSDLNENDILLVDSSHVSKTGSDVNMLLFEVLPALKNGVYIHFHDVFFPFEYPKAWVYKGVAWNEAYMLRAFLQYNDAFEISFFTSFMLQCHKDKVLQHIPSAMKSEVADPTLADCPGASIWLRKVASR